MATYFIGIDVGTGSARAGIFDRDGALVASARRDIALYRDGADIAEQSSDDIWAAVCASVREAVAVAGVGAAAIAGIGFDATCSLVVLDREGRPLPVGAHGDTARNIIVWMDHRATGQARRINAAGHRVLDYVGGAISPEMETPKLLWLKENLPATYGAAWQFFDLADYLTWRATGSLARSTCTVTCKWTYMAHEGRWDESYFRQIGLGDLADQGFGRIGTEIVPAGQALASGLTAQAAGELGLRPGTAVGAGLIDAHAGGVGTVGGAATTSMAYVLGTSACTMASSAEPVFIPGVWGPYRSAMVPGLWLSEGGQSSAGAAIDQVVALHPAAPEAARLAVERGLSLPDMLAERAAAAASSLSEAMHLAGRLVVVPDFLGNRSPHADPEARAAIAGLGMERDLDSLVALYVAGLLGLGYGLRQIIAASRTRGATIETIALSGGAGRHPLVRQLLADCTGMPVAVAYQAEPVLLGAAMLGATASGAFASLGEAMAAMTGGADEFRPAGGEIAAAHARRFAAFETLQQAARAIRDLAATEVRETASLRLDRLQKSFGPVDIIKGVDLEIADGEFVVFVGPSGCGKSTLLRMIAGLEDISGGDLFIDGARCNEMEPRDRGIAMVFQSYALYPHLTVHQNMSFGLTLNRTPKVEIEARVGEAARILKLEELLQRRPAQLSGGQRQRVAIGRAIVRKPKVFLFDEPLSNLDAALRMDMRMEIARLHKELGATMVYVTHDQVEAMTLADKIVVLDAGRVQQIGAPIELYKKPANRFVAGFIGSPKMNFLDVRVTGVSGGTATVESATVLPVAVAASGLAAGDRAVLGVRPQVLRREAGPAGAIRGTVSLVERLGAETIVSLDTASGERALAVIPQDEIFEAGSAVEFRFEPAAAHLFAA